ncbi:hypothetical protein DFH09DRAFT_1069952 [Mycena vulgaris]|nr:hypothetical protein DFH09DRAFT_1069952 [Mycena vulgaris]
MTLHPKVVKRLTPLPSPSKKSVPGIIYVSSDFDLRHESGKKSVTSLSLSPEFLEKYETFPDYLIHVAEWLDEKLNARPAIKKPCHMGNKPCTVRHRPLGHPTRLPQTHAGRPTPKQAILEAHAQTGCKPTPEQAISRPNSCPNRQFRRPTPKKGILQPTPNRVIIRPTPNRVIIRPTPNRVIIRTPNPVSDPHQRHSQCPPPPPTTPTPTPLSMPAAAADDPRIEADPAVTAARNASRAAFDRLYTFYQVPGKGLYPLHQPNPILCETLRTPALLEARVSSTRNRTCHIPNCDLVALKQAGEQAKLLATELATQRAHAGRKIEGWKPYKNNAAATAAPAAGAPSQIAPFVGRPSSGSPLTVPGTRGQFRIHPALRQDSLTASSSAATSPASSRPHSPDLPAAANDLDASIFSLADRSPRPYPDDDDDDDVASLRDHEKKGGSLTDNRNQPFSNHYDHAHAPNDSDGSFADTNSPNDPSFYQDHADAPNGSDGSFVNIDNHSFRPDQDNHASPYSLRDESFADHDDDAFPNDHDAFPPDHHAFSPAPQPLHRVPQPSHRVPQLSHRAPHAPLHAHHAPPHAHHAPPHAHHAPPHTHHAFSTAHDAFATAHDAFATAHDVFATAHDASHHASHRAPHAPHFDDESDDQMFPLTRANDPDDADDGPQDPDIIWIPWGDDMAENMLSLMELVPRDDPRLQRMADIVKESVARVRRFDAEDRAAALNEAPAIHP